ncbi:hypothetical protein CEUSTIGMA_g4172.t1 [Chlamydomonas eustigma]|uniref:CHASE domain-containing protein n=1 Tax=Chlamydomonas eustigma TaxID=1157962 RepID=A0A250X0Z4_9CHLO|nr:hypothetical protein CEUSTIGMA_g4172.t1 [Chlamydomonas eustigma]|eukprot:GAX76725.1 hypothetical protein CEUSTIGMA_g4172.t1 [Chlamydomonas eustigma]
MVSWPSLTLLASEVRQRPGITAWPIFIFLLLTISFEVGVYEGAQLWEASSKTDARSLAMSTSSAFSNRFQGATALLNAASSVIHVDAMSSNPSNWTVMRSYLEGLLTDLIESYNVNLIQVLPMGITELLVPEGSTTIELGSNFFLTSILPAMQTEALLLNTWPNDTVLGPFKFSDPGWGVNVVSLIFLPNSVNISRLALPHNPFFGNCTLCKSVNPGHQLWGLAIVYLDLSDVRSGLDPSLSQLSSKYDYILWENGAYSQYENASISRKGYLHAFPTAKSLLYHLLFVDQLDVVLKLSAGLNQLNELLRHELN